MIIFTAVWGQFFECLEFGFRASLAFPKNAESVKDATWVFATLEEETERCKKIAGNIKTEFIYAGKDENGADFLKRALIHTMGLCIERKEPFLMAPPDSIFADGTIETLKRVGVDEASCVCFAHMRVLPSFLLEMAGKVLSSSQMVSLAYKHAHGTWTHAERGKEQSNSFHGGICG